MQQIVVIESQTQTQVQTPTVRIGAGPGRDAQTLTIPRSIEEMTALRSRREELIDQLDRARTRRSGVVEELRNGSRRERVGLEERLRELDGRILQIEGDIARTERSIASTPPAVLGEAEQIAEAERLERIRDRGPDGDVIAVIAAMGFFMLIPLAFAHARRLWRRPPKAGGLTLAMEGRLERIEHAVEAVADEVGRVSEGQRFVTSLMSEAGQGARAPAPNRLANS